MPGSPPPTSERSPSRVRAGFAAAAALALICVATLTPVEEPQVALEHVCVVCGAMGMQDFLDNILLFVPLGAALRLAGLSWPRAVLASLFVTLGVEGLQYKVVTGRDASVGDLLSNTMGGALGAWLAAHWRALASPRPALARRLALGGLAGWLGVLVATAWALTPSVPAGPILSQWAPVEPGLSVYHGEVLAVALDGTPLPAGPVPEPLERIVRDRFRAGDAVLAARVTTGNERGQFAPIARLRTTDSSDVAALGEQGCDFEVHVRMHVHDIRMRDPALVAARVFPCGGLPDRALGEPEGDTMEVMGGRRGSELVLLARGRGRVVERRVALTPTLGWSFFLPFRYPFGGLHWPLSALWAGGLILVVAYWGGRGRSRSALPVLLATAAVGLGGVAPAFGLATPGLGEWLAAGVAIAAGWAVGRGTVARTPRTVDARPQRADGSALIHPVGADR